MRTYLYKLTSDRGGAPCCLEPQEGEEAVLSLAICKPAIRRTAEPGDRIIGVASRALERADGYVHGAVIYAAIVGEALDARDYFEAGGGFLQRPDCIYTFHRETGEAVHRGMSKLHAGAKHVIKDLGRYPLYRNGRVLVCRDFRYFGAEAMPIPARLGLLVEVAETLGQGHRVYREGSAESKEADALFRLLWKKSTRYTPSVVDGDAYDRH
jgi:hypothetical protein